MNKEFFEALDLLEREKGISKQYMMEKVEAALVSAFKKELGGNTNVRILLNEDKKDMKVYQQKTVVEFVENPDTEISLEDAKPELDGIIAGENNFQKILSHINRHLTTIKSVDDISSALFFSKSYIMHLFKSELRVGVMQYVRNKKILLAHQKIRKGEKPTEVYAKCGFSNYPSFYRAYCAYFGESPKCAKSVE